MENRPGAGTTIGMKAASLAEPDGYTLLFQSSSLVVAPAMYKNLDYDPLKSFAPVVQRRLGLVGHGGAAVSCPCIRRRS